MTRDQQEIIMGGVECSLYKYKKEYESYSEFRWIFEKRGVDNEKGDIFSIRNVESRARIFYTIDSEVILHNEIEDYDNELERKGKI